MKYWVRAKQRREEEPVRQWYKRQIGVLRFECWTRRQDTIGLGLCTGKSLVLQATSKEMYYLLHSLLTPWCRVLLEKLTGLQLVKKFPTFYGT